MATEALKMMKEQLMGCVQGQLGDISKVDTHELGEAVDMIKDLAEAIYYCTITESMEKAQQQQGGTTNVNYYTTPMQPYDKMYPDYYRDMERQGGYMYYGGGGGGRSGSSSGGSNGSNSGSGTSYSTEMMPGDMRRDPR